MRSACGWCSSSAPDSRWRWPQPAACSCARAESTRDCAHPRRDFQQRRIELHERVVDSRVLLMTGQAAGAFGKRRRFFAATFEAEVGPLLREPSLVFDRRFDGDDILLKATALEDRFLI